MNNEKLYLTIDTKLLKSKTPEETTLYLEKEIEECYTKVWVSGHINAGQLIADS